MYEDHSKSHISNKLTGTLAITQVDTILQQHLRTMQKERDIYAAREQARELAEIIKDFLAMPAQDGHADVWHNFAASLARNDHFELACDVLDRAIALNGKNTDLLADYLNYGLCCNRKEQCKIHHETLQKIPRVKYSWRAFSFSIDYLMYEWEQSDSLEEMDELEKQMLDLASDFRKYFPHQEESFSSEADVYTKLRVHDKVIETLETALATLARTPKCALQLADIMFERCEYQKALSALERALKNANEPQQGINAGYAHCLAGLCKLANAELQGTALTPETLRDIYLEFNLAVSDEYRHAHYRGTIKEKARELQLRYNTQIPMEFEDLDALVNRR